MDERGANIDILFRNGLKDYEVLPPPEVWNNIRPAVRKNQRPIIIFRAAAMIAILLSLSFMAYKWSTQIPSELISNSYEINPESYSPVSVLQKSIMVADAKSAQIPITESVSSLPSLQPEKLLQIKLIIL
jgi:hypothetical protein